MRSVMSDAVIAAVAVAVVAAAVAPCPVAAQDAPPVDVLVAQVGMGAAPNMGLEMMGDLSDLIDARPNMISREWADLVAAADLPEQFRSQLPDEPVCIHARNALGFAALGVDYLLCGGGRLRHDGIVDVQLRVWDMAGACWLFVPPEIVPDRDAAVAYLDSAFARWIETGEPADVRCEESPGVGRPLRSDSLSAQAGTFR